MHITIVKKVYVLIYIYYAVTPMFGIIIVCRVRITVIQRNFADHGGSH
jgi:hypothetical protein